MNLLQDRGIALHKSIFNNYWTAIIMFVLIYI